MDAKPLPTDPSVRIRKVRSPGGFDVWLIGGSSDRSVDLFHGFLRLSWPGVIGTIAGSYVAVNLLFACAYAATGGIAHARPGSLVDAFWFSFQTMGTIGYGAMYPETTLANALVASESVVGLLVTAIATGLVFARFTRIASRIVFTTHAVITPMEGVPTLTFRVGNDRLNTVLDARISVTLSRVEKTREGVTFYRNYDLKLVRDRNFALTRTWTVMHTITPDSPLYGTTPEGNVENQVEINVFVQGTDDTTHQPVFGNANYESEKLVYGARHADVLAYAPDGLLTLDLRDFDTLVPTKPIDGFPYPAT